MSMSANTDTEALASARIIDLYFARDERAISETDARYGRLCLQVSLGILGEGSRPDAEECVNDAYLRTWNSIPPTRPHSLRAFLCRIVRNLSINRLRDLTNPRRARDLTVSLAELEACIPAPAEDDRELARHISDFLKKLDTLDCRLFMGRYWYGQPVKALASEWKLSANAVSLRLLKTRERLRTYLTERGYMI